MTNILDEFNSRQVQIETDSAHVHKEPTLLIRPSLETSSWKFITKIGFSLPWFSIRFLLFNWIYTNNNDDAGSSGYELGKPAFKN